MLLSKVIVRNRFSNSLFVFFYTNYFLLVNCFFFYFSCVLNDFLEYLEIYYDDILQ